MEWLIIVIVVLVVALFLLQYWFGIRKRSKWSRKDVDFCRTNWQRIQSMDDARHQVVEADKLFDHMMRRKGYQGSVANMLKQNGKKFSDLNGLWSAHKLRNRLAHELNYAISDGAARGALKAFRRALQDLGLEL